MAARSGMIDPEIARELEAVAAGQGCELVHVSFNGGVLRLVLDRLEGGVTLADCEVVSRETSALLDVLDFGAGRYTLEVSSPGLDRELYGPRDYERFAGHRVRVTFRAPDTGAKRTVRGQLTAFHPGAGSAGEGGSAGQDEAGDNRDQTEGIIEVTIEERKEPEVLSIPLSSIQVARLEIEL